MAFPLLEVEYESGSISAVIIARQYAEDYAQERLCMPGVSRVVLYDSGEKGQVLKVWDALLPFFRLSHEQQRLAIFVRDIEAHIGAMRLLAENIAATPWLRDSYAISQYLVDIEDNLSDLGQVLRQLGAAELARLEGVMKKEGP